MTDDRPIIGIVAALEQARYGAWDSLCALTPSSYVQAVQRAGGIAVLIPADSELADDPEAILERIDGLMLAGGGDIDPEAYGAVAHPETTGTVPARDQIELSLMQAAWDRDMPVLGICRGMQLINVARGGTLAQHLPELVGHGEHRRVLGSFVGSDHDVELEMGSLAARAAGEETHVTKSHHHQGIAAVGEGLVVTGHSTLDELPEAIEAPERTYVLGVQWHPEADPDSRVVESLIEEARAYRATRSA
jgi:putative glutamine amidotransferase